MKIAAIVQARVASTRLPAKVLLDLGGRTALERCLRRVERFTGITDIVVATSDTAPDDIVSAVAIRLGFKVFRGSEHDVLSRYAGAAAMVGAEAVVRCTSDCPLLDPAISSSVISAFVSSQPRADYASNILERRLPRGLDTEILSAETLRRAHEIATAKDEREHVTLHVYRRPETYRCLPVSVEMTDLSSLRWTLDTLDDYRFLHAVFERLGPRAETATMRDVVALLDAEPALKTINANVVQKHV